MVVLSHCSCFSVIVFVICVSFVTFCLDHTAVS